MNAVNERLRQVYLDHWDKYSELLFEINRSSSFPHRASNPLLISLNEEAEYAKAGIKVMILGKETNGWGHDFHGGLNKCLDSYEGFYHSDGYPYSYGGHFWNGFKRLIFLLKERFPEQSVKAVWNNVIKTGRADERGRPCDEILVNEHPHFNVLSGEINILSPDIIVATCGWGYDDVISIILPEIERKQELGKFSSNELYAALYEGTPFFRTYHPQYLYSKNIDSYFNPIISAWSEYSTN